MSAHSTIRSRLEEHGFVLASESLSDGACDELVHEIAGLEVDERRRGGVRNLLDLMPSIATLLRSEPLSGIVADAVSPAAFPVRAILFDKNLEANWHVRWHQDATIAVDRRLDEFAGFTGWSEKEGVFHVHPPAEMLERMVTLRIHLDPCDATSGALRVLRASHRSSLAEARERGAEERVCAMPRGGILVMKPLLWHASSKMSSERSRRVLHLEFADFDLPRGLNWRWGRSSF